VTRNEKISLALAGKPKTPEHRANISAALKGKQPIANLRNALARIVAGF
jgi:hypothetical protein